MKFRMKPVVVEATQWFKHGDHAAVVPAIDGPEGISTWVDVWKGTGPEIAVISTLKGTMIVSPGDWIVTGVRGEQYPLSPDVFKAIYEPA